ncbi:MAG TPA: response regulator [Gemmatimonadales bacterium]|nr:response regulator [Gemmatimonadales bacterium]
MAGDATPPDLPPELREEYLENMRGQLGALTRIAERLTAVSNDPEALATLLREAHKIHGSAGSYGFMEASRLAAGMEATVKDWAARPADTEVDRGSLAGWFVTRLAGMLGLELERPPAVAPPTVRPLPRVGPPPRPGAGPPASAPRTPPTGPSGRPLEVGRRPASPSPPAHRPPGPRPVPTRPDRPGLPVPPVARPTAHSTSRGPREEAPAPVARPPGPAPLAPERLAPGKPSAPLADSEVTHPTSPPPPSTPEPAAVLPPADPNSVRSVAPEAPPAETSPTTPTTPAAVSSAAAAEANPPLPTAAAPATAAPEAAPAPDVPEIIFVEDDAALAELLQYGLHSRGYHFAAYRNGRDALRELLALDVGGTHPLLLLDVDLPALDGYTIFEALQRERPGIYRVVFTTVHGTEDEQLRGLEAGALDYLVKPISLRVALEKIKRWVGR